MKNQEPLGSGLGPRTTAEEALAGADLAGKLAVVTGGYAGIGLETVRVLAGAGANVIVPARDLAKAHAALDGMPRTTIAPLDLADPASIDAFGRALAERPVHLYIANAGVMAMPLGRDARGHELQLVTNHLGHFQLGARLWPGLVRAGGARVVVLSSGAHRFGGFDFEDFDWTTRPYDRWKAYGQSKTANALYAVALDSRGKEQGVRAFSVHPGSIGTDLQRHVTLADQQAMGFRDAEGNLTPRMAALWKTVPEGAATTVWCATSRQLDGHGGVYCEDGDIARAVPAEDPGLAGVLPWARDPDAAARLWTLSEELTGCRHA